MMAPIDSSASKGEVIVMEKLQQRRSSDASTALPEDDQTTDAMQGVLSAVILGNDLRDSWSWHQRSGCGEKAPKLPSAPVASPTGFDGVPSAVVLGEDLQVSWSWHQRSGRMGQMGTKGKEEITDKDVPPRFPMKQPRFTGVPSSVVTGNVADRMQAWQWR
jgi:hypothetical protein